MQSQVATVIPFYQEAEGVLQRALASVAQQKGVKAIFVTVVDDSSPVPAMREIENVRMPSSITVEVASRPNGGPAAARNTGLGSLPADIRYVAFLDSDDEWAVDHLSRAVSALSAGYDFYFSDLLHLGQTVSAFKRAGRIDVSKHRILTAGKDLYAYEGDMFDQIMRGNIIGTSTVVFDRLKHPNVRFREEYYSAGEDYLCWMDFAIRGARFAFSSQCEAKYGRGVNVYTGAKWGTARHLERVHNEFKYRRATKQLYKVTPEQSKFLDLKEGELRQEFAGSLMHMVRRRLQLPMRVLARQIALDPTLTVEPFAMFARKITNRFR